MSPRWKASDIKTLEKAGRAKIQNTCTTKLEREYKKLNAVVPEGIKYIRTVLDRLQVPYTPEYVFSKERKFRFDFALIDRRIAVEYNGLQIGGAEKSGHTTITGHSKDCEKINLAQIEGWTVLQYTALNYGQFENDLLKLLKQG